MDPQCQTKTHILRMIMHGRIVQSENMANLTQAITNLVRVILEEGSEILVVVD